ncbi:MAG: MBL fold metallo-hydrolase [Bacilli bacterium]|jgi:phosphoribosyl 1,2-cyclic phosphodiesterase|nr:MBL fold metallo-hydrolase [Bacilli bacterium]
MKIYNFISGSKGNSTLVRCDDYNILIDIGNTKKYLLECLSNINLTLEDIDIILITHFHTDHFKEAKYLEDLNIYSRLNKHHDLSINKDNIFNDVIIKPFKLSHDDECYGYQIKDNNEVYTHISDTGLLKEEYYKYIKEADYLYLEFNHDPQLLQRTDRPALVKRRISSTKGHLSNQEAAVILAQSNGKLKDLLVAHISEEANDIDVIAQEINKVFNDFEKEIDFNIQYTGFMKVSSCGKESDK